jgi:hypothetical protein
MRGRFDDVEPLRVSQNPTAAMPVITPNIGIAAVTPSYFLHDILFLDTLKKFCADHAVAEPPGKSEQPGK